MSASGPRTTGTCQCRPPASELPGGAYTARRHIHAKQDVQVFAVCRWGPLRPRAAGMQPCRAPDPRVAEPSSRRPPGRVVARARAGAAALPEDVSVLCRTPSVGGWQSTVARRALRQRQTALSMPLLIVACIPPNDPRITGQFPSGPRTTRLGVAFNAGLEFPSATGGVDFCAQSSSCTGVSKGHPVFPAYFNVHARTDHNRIELRPPQKPVLHPRTGNRVRHSSVSYLS